MNSPFFPERGSDLLVKSLSAKGRHQALVTASVKKLEAACLEAVYGYEISKGLSYYESVAKGSMLEINVPIVPGVCVEETAQPVIDALKVVGINAYLAYGRTLVLCINEEF